VGKLIKGLSRYLNRVTYMYSRLPSVSQFETPRVSGFSKNELIQKDRLRLGEREDEVLMVATSFGPFSSGIRTS
jgi:hypothetical protein